MFWEPLRAELRCPNNWQKSMFYLCLLLFFLSCIVADNIFECESIKRAKPSQGSDCEDYFNQFNCSSHGDELFSITSSHWSYNGMEVKITCNTNVTWADFDGFSMLDFTIAHTRGCRNSNWWPYPDYPLRVSIQHCPPVTSEILHSIRSRTQNLNLVYMYALVDTGLNLTQEDSTIENLAIINDHAIDSITPRSLQMLTKLRWLDISRCGLMGKNYEFLMNLPQSLEVLELNYNRIELDDITCAHLRMIYHLDLGYNQLPFIPSGCFNNGRVGWLSLSGSNLTRINNTTFAGPNRMLTLDLSESPITYFERGALCPVDELQSMNLRKVPLTSELVKSLEEAVKTCRPRFLKIYVCYGHLNNVTTPNVNLPFFEVSCD